MVHCSQLPDADEEWAFARDLVVEWHDSRARCAEISPPPSPAGDLAYTATSTSPTMGGSCPTGPSSAMSCNHDNADVSEEIQRIPTSNPKQMRRKTVIIQAPDGDFEPALVEKVEKTYSSFADREVDLLPDEPVPFEAPAPATLEMQGTDVLTPAPGSRPSSTTSAKLPVRGILKEKKSVRFSAVPSLHEYVVEGPLCPSDDIAPPCRPISCPGTPSRQDLKSSTSPPRGRASWTTLPFRRSPLREVHSPNDLRSDASTRGSTATTTAAASFPPRLSPAPTGPLPPAPRSAPALRSGTMAKHPAVRAFARRPPVGSGVGGAVVGAPGLQPPEESPLARKGAGSGPSPRAPTPALLDARRRAPLRAANTRLNMPVPAERHRDAVPLIPVTTKRPAQSTPQKAAGARKGRENVDAGGTRAISSPLPLNGRVLRFSPAKEKANSPGASVGGPRQTPSSARKSKGANGGDTAGAHASPKHATGGSRMAVPLRTIFTKFRA